MTNNLNLSSKKFYRFILVTYYFFLIFSFWIVYLDSFRHKPYQWIDRNNSYVECIKTSTKTSFKKAHIIDENLKLTLKNEIPSEIIKLCKIPPLIQWSHEEIEHFSLGDFSDYFKVSFFYYSEGSWMAVIVDFLEHFLIFFLIIDLFKQSILYIFYGKTISWIRIIRSLKIFARNKKLI